MSTSKSYVKSAYDAKVLSIPVDYGSDTSYEVIMGSQAYAVSNNDSDLDLYAMVIPPINVIYPHLNGYVYGLFDAPKVFETVNHHHVNHRNKSIDFNIFSVNRYFNLCADNNPNMLDSLFVPDRCIIHMDAAGQILRERRHDFLYKGAFQKYRGYFFAQMKKLKEGALSKSSRKELIELHGYDSKTSYHIVRLALQIQDLLTTGTMNLEAHREILKSIRRGEWSMQKLEEWTDSKQKELDVLYTNSTALPFTQDFNKLKKLFYDVVEAKNGSISSYLNSSIDQHILIKAAKYDRIVKSFELINND